jgi:phosphoribosylamine---glycine ligase
VSVFALTDGATVVPLLPAQDFKRAFDGDEGPNTGGMGAYTPLPWAPADLATTVASTIIQPTIDELRRRETPYVGVLYAGLVLTAGGPRVIEFNARFGDPEAQVVLDRLATPLSGLLEACAVGTLASAPALEWHPGAAVTVVVAAENYPGDPVTGDPVAGLEEAAQVEGAYVLQAGTKLERGLPVTGGGRVLNVVGTGPDVPAARARAYAAVDLIRLRGAHHRTDIAAGV